MKSVIKEATIINTTKSTTLNPTMTNIFHKETYANTAIIFFLRENPGTIYKTRICDMIDHETAINQISVKIKLQLIEIIVRIK